MEEEKLYIDAQLSEINQNRGASRLAAKMIKKVLENIMNR